VGAGSAEDFEGRVSVDAVRCAKVLLNGAVNLGEGDVLFLQCCCGLLVLGCESLAVTTPWREELCEDEVVLLGEVLERVLAQINDVAGSSDGRKAK